MASKSDVQAKLDAAVAALAKTTSSWPSMVKRYGSDWQKWPTSTQWSIALADIQAARAEVGLLIDPSPPPASLTVTIIGTPQSGQTLVASVGGGTGPYNYQWRRCDMNGGSCNDIAAATASTYTATDSDVGATIRVKVSDPTGVVQSIQTTVVQPVTPPPPPPVGTLLTDVDYAQPSPFGWTWQIQAGNYGFNDSGHAGMTFEVVSDPTGLVRKVAHINLPIRSGGHAAEGTARRYIDLGTTDFYAFSIRVPVGWHLIPQDPSWHTVAAQFCYGSLGGPPVGLIVYPNDLYVMLLSGKVVNSGGGVSGYELVAAPNSGVHLNLLTGLTAHEGEWVDLAFEIKWATTWNGYVNGWSRVKGGTWVQTVDTQKSFGKLVPTQQWGDGENVQTDVNGIVTGSGGSWPTLNIPGKPMFATDKAGLYAGPSTSVLDFWHSTFKRGTTFDVVTAALG